MSKPVTCTCKTECQAAVLCQKCGGLAFGDDRSRGLAAQAAAIAAGLVSTISKGGEAPEVKAAIDRAAAAFTSVCSAALSRELEDEARRNALKSRDSYRASCVAELLTSEKDYLQDLYLLDSAWHAAVISSGALSREEVQLIFSGLHGMILLSTELVEALQEAKDKPINEQRVGEAFRSRIPYVKLYIEYTQNQVVGLELILKALKKSSKFRSALEQVRTSNSAMKGVDFQGFLIKPTQRIVKYPLFLRDLIAHTAENHPDYAALVSAEEEMKKVLFEINQKRQWKETVVFVSKLAITWKSDAIDLLASHCVLVHQAKVRCVVTFKSDPPVEPEKAKRLIMFKELLLVVRGTHVHAQEVVTLLIQDIQGVKEEEQNIVISCPKRSLEITLFPPNASEQRLWFQVISDTVKAAPPEPAQFKYVILPPPGQPPADIPSQPPPEGTDASAADSSKQPAEDASAEGTAKTPREHPRLQKREPSRLGTLILGGLGIKRETPSPGTSGSSSDHSPATQTPSPPNIGGSSSGLSPKSESSTLADTVNQEEGGHARKRSGILGRVTSWAETRLAPKTPTHSHPAARASEEGGSPPESMKIDTHPSPPKDELVGPPALPPSIIPGEPGPPPTAPPDAETRSKKPEGPLPPIPAPKPTKLDAVRSPPVPASVETKPEKSALESKKPPAPIPIEEPGPPPGPPPANAPKIMSPKAAVDPIPGPPPPPPSPPPGPPPSPPPEAEPKLNKPECPIRQPKPTKLETVRSPPVPASAETRPEKSVEETKAEPLKATHEPTGHSPVHSATAHPTHKTTAHPAPATVHPEPKAKAHKIWPEDCHDEPTEAGVIPKTKPDPPPVALKPRSLSSSTDSPSKPATAGTNMTTKPAAGTATPVKAPQRLSRPMPTPVPRHPLDQSGTQPKPESKTSTPVVQPK